MNVRHVQLIDLVYIQRTIKKQRFGGCKKGARLEGNDDGTVVIAVAAGTGVVEVAVHEVVDVAVVGEGLVAAVGAVDVCRIVGGALVRAAGRLGARGGQEVVVDVVAVHVVEVAVVEVVPVALVAQTGVAAVGAVDVVVGL